MGLVAVPSVFTAQPQYPAPLNPSHWIAKKTTLAINCAFPAFNAATGQPLTITGGGSGFSLRATPLGMSLYTPNGGWSDISVGQDWRGPNTVIALCRVNSIDSPWGGFFSKDSAGTSTQLAMGRNDTTDSLYGSVDDSSVASFGGASIPSLTGFNVLIFTHSGVASTAMSYYRNGALVGTTTALGTQPSGAGVLGLGRSRDSSATYDSDVDWIGFLRVADVLSAAQGAEISQNIWAAWQAEDELIWVPGSSGDGVGSASGSSVVAGVGASIAASVGSSPGSASVSGAGASTAASAGSSGGVASASGVGASTASTVGSSAGVATVSGVGSSSAPGSAVGSASGSSSVSGVGASVAASVGTASGSSSVSGISPAPVSTGGHYAGVAYTGKRPKRDLVDRDREDIKQLIRGQLREVRAEIIKAEVPQEVKAQARAVIKPLQQSINVQALQHELSRVRQMLHMWEQQVKREREEDEELLFMLL